jgi:hypothetical protein
VTNSLIKQQLDIHCTLATSTSTDKSNICSRLNLDRETTKDTNGRPSRIPKVDIVQTDMALSLRYIDLLSSIRFGVNERYRVKELENICTGTGG